MPLAQANGIDLYHEETDAGPPLPLGGSGGTTLGWLPLPPALDPRFRVLAFDGSGCGRSAAPPGPFITRLLADAAAALDLLGLGVQPPAPSWGWTVAFGTRFLGDAPHLSTFPGLAIMVSVIGFNLLGDGLRDLLDPRSLQR